METRLKILSQQFEKALIDFESALDISFEGLDPRIVDVLKSGQVQKFEFTIQLFWKLLKWFLYDHHGIDAASPKQTIRSYFELGFCDTDEVDGLLEAVDLRNRLSHIYDKEKFENIYTKMPECRRLLRAVFDKKPW